MDLNANHKKVKSSKDDPFACPTSSVSLFPAFLVVAITFHMYKEHHPRGGVTADCDLDPRPCMQIRRALGAAMEGRRRTVMTFSEMSATIPFVRDDLCSRVSVRTHKQG